MKERRLRRDRYTENGEKKLCTGVLHKSNPTYLPLSQYFILKSGRMAGKPMSECMECWRARQGRAPDSGMVPHAEGMLVFNRLVGILGSKGEVCRRLGKQRTALSRKNKYFKLSFVREAEQLLYQLEREQRIQESGYGRLSRSGEAEVVMADQLIPHIMQFEKEWLAERPLDSRKGYHQNSNDIFMGPVAYLAEKTGLNPRRVGAIKNGEIPRVPLSQADALLVAMRKQYLIMSKEGETPEIQIIPNPNWTMDQYLTYMRERGCV